jgi:hypothetical protein
VCCLVGGVVLVSELVSALWFEDVGFLHEQMLDTPVGRFSIRQMCLFLVFGLFGWLLSLVFADLVLKLCVGGGVFLVGATLFSRKVKTIPPEVHLLYLTRRVLLVKTKGSKQVGGLSGENTYSRSLLLSGSLGVPVKVVGVLKDLATGKILSGKNFKVSVNDAVHSRGAADEDGCFCAYFVPDRFGVFQIEIQPEDSVESVQQIMVNVNPKSEEEKQNAKTTS